MVSLYVDLRALAAALDGEIANGQVLCAGPGHSAKDRSLAVEPIASGGFILHSFAGDDWRLCRAHVHERLGFPRWREQPSAPSPRCKAHPQSDPKQNVERAKALWNEGRDPRVSLVLDYLASRRLNLPEELCGPVLRFHPGCPWRAEDRVEFIPCLIAAFTSIEDNAVTAIHRIRLDRPQDWPKTTRKMLGDAKGSAIKLDATQQRLCIAEGLETALASRQLGFAPVWALGSSGKISAFPPLDGVTELTILGERDDVNRKAAEACSRRWTMHGRHVFLAMPTLGKDFNDYMMGAV